MAVPSIIAAVAISGLWGDKNRCKCRRGTVRRFCVITRTKPRSCLWSFMALAEVYVYPAGEPEGEHVSVNYWSFGVR